MSNVFFLLRNYVCACVFFLVFLLPLNQTCMWVCFRNKDPLIIIFLITRGSCSRSCSAGSAGCGSAAAAHSSGSAASAQRVRHGQQASRLAVCGRCAGRRRKRHRSTLCGRRRTLARQHAQSGRFEPRGQRRRRCLHHQQPQVPTARQPQPQPARTGHL